MGQSLEDRWKRQARKGVETTAAFSEDGLVLGAGTLLVRIGSDEQGAIWPDTERDHDRLITLLAVLTRGRVAPDVRGHVDAAAAYWKRGDKALANIRLGLARLPRVEALDDAYRLFLAAEALACGVLPRCLLKELGIDATEVGLLKRDVSGEARLSGGQHGGGEFTSDGALSDVAGNAKAPKRGPRAAFLDLKGDENQEAKDKRDEVLGIETEEEAVAHGHPIPIAPMVSGVGPVPRTVAPPAIQGLGGAETPVDASTPRRNEEPFQCAAPKPDIENGSDRGKAYQRLVAQLTNPADPTPDGKAYFLPNPARGNKPVSYDDCRKTNEPTSIPGLRVGDMVEAKNKTYDFLLTNNMKGKNKTLDGLDDQVKRQNEAIRGTGRRIVYCFEGGKAAEIARSRYSVKYKDSSFEVCD